MFIRIVRVVELCIDTRMSNSVSKTLVEMIFDTFDFLAPEVVDLLHRVQRVMHNNVNVMSSRSMNVVFTRIGFVI